jgi:hypothetical protein
MSIRFFNLSIRFEGDKYTVLKRGTGAHMDALAASGE